MASDFNGSPKQRLLPMSSILAPGGTGTIRDIPSSFWFGRLQPVKPTAPSTYPPRQYAYNPGSNLIWQPKGEDAITFETLRALADSWDLLRICLETAKDRLCDHRFEVRPKRKPKEK